MFVTTVFYTLLVLTLATRFTQNATNILFFIRSINVCCILSVASWCMFNRRNNTGVVHIVYTCHLMCSRSNDISNENRHQNSSTFLLCCIKCNNMLSYYCLCMRYTLDTIIGAHQYSALFP